MKQFKSLFLFALASFIIVSCDSDDDNSPVLLPVEAETVSNLFAPTTGGGMGQPDEGPFTKFDFATGMITNSNTEWDIAFRSTAIIVNGGNSQGSSGEPDRTADAAAYVERQAFGLVNQVDLSSLRQDSPSELAIVRVSDSDMGWYSYSGFAPGLQPEEQNLVTPIAGRTLVFKTRNNTYAKVQIISYYENNPQPPIGGFGPNASTGRYYTFNYVYNPNPDDITFD